jgi:hypothetical protein
MLERLGLHVPPTVERQLRRLNPRHHGQVDAEAESYLMTGTMREVGSA